MEKAVKKAINYPVEGELVVATITKIQNYGAFASLEEYPGCEGMIHVSEISPKWIRNIRDYVKEDQKVVLKVIGVDKEKEHIGLSLKRVRPAERKETLDQYKREKKAKKLIELVAGKLNETEKINEIIDALYAKSDLLYNLFEKSLVEGEVVFEGAKISPTWKKALLDIVKDYIEIPEIEIKANLELMSKAPNGLEVIKNALLAAEKEKVPKEVVLKIKYLGAPKYRIEITAPNYKVAEQLLNKVSKKIIEDVTKAQGSGKLIR